jgi:hypothetical protein
VNPPLVSAHRSEERGVPDAIVLRLLVAPLEQDREPCLPGPLPDAIIFFILGEQRASLRVDDIYANREIPRVTLGCFIGELVEDA